MNESLSRLLARMQSSAGKWVPVLVVVLLIAVAVVSWETWAPQMRGLLAGAGRRETEAAAQKDAEADHADSVHLSPQAKRNIGLKVDDVALRDFSRKITFPAVLVEHAGRSHYEIASPMTGIITEMAVVRGQSVRSDDVLFRLRLLHEDLVRAQTEFLKTLGELDAEQKEIVRLEKIAGEGVAGRLILERQYARDKLIAVRNAQEEALRLHGLTESQIASIKQKRKLTYELLVRVPRVHGDGSLHYPNESREDGGRRSAEGGKRKAERGKQNTDIQQTLPTLNSQLSTLNSSTTHHAQQARFLVEHLPVHVGQAVKAGQTLCVLADYRVLHIEGRAFEQDAAEIIRAANEKRRAIAIPEAPSGDHQPIPGLEIIHVDNTIDPRSRALNFHVELPNTIVRETRHDGREFFSWKYKPGQRMQLRIPVERWEKVIVLPSEAVAVDGPESYVFVENGKVFVRRPVTVKYRDQFEVVLEHDGSIFPGERIAHNAAHQLLMALKKQAGGGADPHAGHHH